MSAGLLLQMAQTFALLSLVSIGGMNAVLPEVRRQVVDVQGWIDAPTFAALFAIAHAAPGPNIIMVSLIGWQLAGLAGLMVATLSMMLPSCALALLAARTMTRWSDRRWVAVLQQGLVPVALGLLLASGVTMLRVADHDGLTLATSLATAAFVVFSRRNPLWALAAASGVSMLASLVG
jgi:chromate transporter